MGTEGSPRKGRCAPEWCEVDVEEWFMRSMAAVVESCVGRLSRLKSRTDDTEESVHTKAWQGAEDWAITMTIWIMWQQHDSCRHNTVELVLQKIRLFWIRKLRLGTLREMTSSNTKIRERLSDSERVFCRKKDVRSTERKKWSIMLLENMGDLDELEKKMD